MKTSELLDVQSLDQTGGSGVLGATTQSSSVPEGQPATGSGRVLIEVKNVSKRFRFWDDRPTSFKTVLVQLLKGKLEMGSRREFQALSDINFEVRAGEFVGIMGRNGAGKSTLMKILAGIYEPSAGEIKVHDQIAPLIELGAGFHPDLSGYENIYLNAAVLGFGKAATEAAIPAILEFAELGEKIHMPIKNYSSGMLVRLGFAIATHLTAPILLVDELLAVGDYNFQQKCIAKIHELHRAGRTIILITHDPKAVAENCNRCIVIDQTRVVFDGGASEGAQAYLSVLRGESVNQTHEIDRSVLIRKRGTCPVCAGESFVKSKVLWPELIQEWELNPSEVELIENQQGLCCAGCHSNLRSMTLAEAFLSCVDFAGTLDAFTRSLASKDIKVLEVNEAGSLRPWLSRLPGWNPGDYPAVDMAAMPYEDSTFDFVVHSDVLEHVPNPAQAIKECLRVLRPGGHLCFTIPIVPTRLSRSRAGLSPSYHGQSTTDAHDYIVHTEYGADFFVQLIGAGCTDISIMTLGSLEAMALVVSKSSTPQ